jgi:hypothetical protein
MLIMLLVLLISVGHPMAWEESPAMPIAPAAHAITIFEGAIAQLDHLKFLSDWWPVPLNNSSMMNMSG